MNSRLNDLSSALARFDPVTPELLEQRSLQRRTDTKFLGRDDAIESVLASLTASYALLGEPSTYRTYYFDTPDLVMFHNHRRGRRPRQKVRIRHYPGRGLSFFEIKTKQGPSQTRKDRREIPYGWSELGAREDDLLRAHTPWSRLDLRPVVTTTYQRITLVGKYTMERVTLDHALEVSSGARSRTFPSVWIIEVKQARFSLTTPVVRALRDAGVRRARASKYCLGVMSLVPGIRSHRLRPALRAVEGFHHG